jgi:hypothetical protein
MPPRGPSFEKTTSPEFKLLKNITTKMATRRAKKPNKVFKPPMVSEEDLPGIIKEFPCSTSRDKIPEQGRFPSV